jgi:hypothetical protein
MKTYRVTFENGNEKEFSNSSFKGSAIKAIAWAFSHGFPTEIEKIKCLYNGETIRNIKLIVE